MNENLDLTKILKDCPKGTKLYSTVYGDVTLNHIDIDDDKYPILVNIDYDGYESFTKDGRILEDYNAECVLFPSKDNRDWSTFKVPTKLPKSWEDYCKLTDNTINPEWLNDAIFAISCLVKLRDCYNGNWESNWKDGSITKYCIVYDADRIICAEFYSNHHILSFKTDELRDEFLNNFKDLIKIAKPLL